MPAGRYFRGLTTFDLLGNFIPGIILTTGVLVSLPSLHVPNSIAGYFLVGILAFSLGHFVQYHASQATGDRRAFIETMDAVRGESLGEDDSEEETSDEDEESEESDGEESSEESESGLTYQIKRFIVQLCEKIEHLLRKSTIFALGVAKHTIYSVVMPVLWWRLPAQGQRLDDVILPNRVWKDLLETYDIDRGTENYSVLFHMISSEVDDIGSPSRATRFQAIRNFHRGMWISVWYILVYLCVFYVVKSSPFTNQVKVLGIKLQDPYIFGIWSPTWHLGLALALSMVGFWHLANQYEEEFIEYLFTDYVVARKNTSEGDED